MIEPRYIKHELRRTGLTLIFALALTALAIPTLAMCLYGISKGHWMPYTVIVIALLISVRFGLSITSHTLRIRRRLRKQQQPPQRPRVGPIYLGQPEN